MPIDYARMRRRHPVHKRMLTTAVKSGDVHRVVAACKVAVREWDEIGAWPDDWARWQSALQDAYRGAGYQPPDLRDVLSLN